jgi:hypothetical protein
MQTEGRSNTRKGPHPQTIDILNSIPADTCDAIGDGLPSVLLHIKGGHVKLELLS